MVRRKTAASGSKSSTGSLKGTPDQVGQLNLAALEELGQALKASTDQADEALYLFVSFDLVNSTQFKPLYPEQWPLIFRTFYELLDKQVKEQIPAMKLWKYVGDEILFHLRVETQADLIETPVKVFGLLDSVMTSLNLSQELPEHLLAVKGTLWLAPVTYLPPQQREATPDVAQHPRNIRMLVTLEDHQTQVDDFLGPDIDLGFRIARYTDKFKLALSAELAYMLNKLNSKLFSQRLRIVDYQILKGIWSGRHYPIIWYFPDWRKFSSSFDYDASLCSPFIEKIKSDKQQQKITVLPKIFTQTGKLHEIERWFGILSRTQAQPDTEQTNLPPLARMAEVHCVAILFREDGRLLAGRRPLSKSRLPGLWEFGCGQLKLDQRMEACVEEAYLHDFGAEVDTSVFIPIAHYDVQDRKEGRVIPGIIFISRVLNPDEIETRFNSAKHDQIRWLSYPELARLVDDEWVPNARQNMEKAFRIWQNSAIPMPKQRASRKP